MEFHIDRRLAAAAFKPRCSVTIRESVVNEASVLLNARGLVAGISSSLQALTSDLGMTTFL